MQEDTDLGCAGCAATDALPLLGDVTYAPVPQAPAGPAPADEGCACSGGEDEGPCTCPEAQPEVELEPLDDGEAALDLPLDAPEILTLDAAAVEAELAPDTDGLAVDEGGDFDAAEVQPMMGPEYGEAALAPVFSKALIKTLTEDLLRIWGEPPKHCREVGSGGRTEEDFFGDGSDGDLSVNGALGLSRDSFYRNVTVLANGALDTNGYRLFVKGKLTLAADTSVHVNGVAGVLGGQGGGNQTAYVAKGAAGGNGGQLASAGSTAVAGAAGGTGLTTWPSYAPVAVLAGCGGGGGGYCGNSTGATAPVAGAGSIAANGGAGGDGVSDGSSVMLAGGAGGGGGGVLLLYAYEIDNAGTLSANGGAGDDGQVSGNSKGGAGGGGGGGAAIVYYTKASGSGLGTVQANGGAAGAVGGTGTAGSAGVVRTYQVNV